MGIMTAKMAFSQLNPIHPN